MTWRGVIRERSRIETMISVRRPTKKSKVLERLCRLGPTAILSDGEVVFQPRKVERAGLSAAVGGRVLIYIYKEEALEDVERRHPAQHYVVVDDKLRILQAVKQFWGERATPVFPRRGIYGRDPKVVSAFRRQT